MITKAFEPDPEWDYGGPVSFFLSRMPRKKLEFSFGHGDVETITMDCLLGNYYYLKYFLIMWKLLPMDCLLGNYYYL